MQDLAGAVHDVAGPDRRHRASALDLAAAAGDDEELFLRVAVGRMDGSLEIYDAATGQALTRAMSKAEVK